MSKYGFKSWFHYWMWRYRKRKRRLQIEVKPHWDYWNGKKLLLADIVVLGFKDPYDALKESMKRNKRNNPRF